MVRVAVFNYTCKEADQTELRFSTVVNIMRMLSATDNIYDQRLLFGRKAIYNSS